MNSIYVDARIHNASNEILGGVYDVKYGISSYFSLKKINENLMKENIRIQEELTTMKDINMRLIYGDSVIVTDASMPLSEVDNIFKDRDDLDTVKINTSLIIAPNLNKEKYVAARVVNNTVSFQRNYITLNKGSKDNIDINYPVVANGAIVGYVVSVSENYCVVMSVLNVGFKTSGALKDDGSICSISWNGKSIDEVEFSGMSNNTKVEVGDIITTTGFSSIFTEGYVIGTISDLSLVDNMYFKGKVKLSLPMSKLKYVNIIVPHNLNERLKLEQSVKQDKR